MGRFRSLRRTVFLSIVLAVLITGCADGRNEPTVERSGAGHNNGATPSFSGPWADMFRSAYDAAGTDLQRKILADEKITDQENNEVRNAFVTCMRGFDIAVELQERDSLTSTAPPSMTDDEYERISKDCRAETSGQISGLYYQINRNPENQDEFAIMADCLSRAGLVDKGYSAGDYEAAFTSGQFPFDENDPRYRSCGLDPLNLAEHPS